MRGGTGNDSIFGGAGNDLLYGGDGHPPNVAHTVRPILPSDGNDVILGGDGRDTVDGGNGNNILDAGDDHIRETVLAGSGNDLAFAHCVNRDGKSDKFALDGGTNRVYVSGGLTEPVVPGESTVRVKIVVNLPRVPGSFAYQPGNPNRRYSDPLGPAHRHKLPSKTTFSYATPFTARRALFTVLAGRGSHRSTGIASDILTVRLIHRVFPGPCCSIASVARTALRPREGGKRSG